MSSLARIPLLSLLALALLSFGCASETASCPEGESACGTSCVDTWNDPTNCGGCGLSCAAGELCIEGVCGCPDGAEDCDVQAPDLFATCFQAGQVIPFLKEEGLRAGPAFSGMEGPQTMARLDDDHIVVVGSMDQTLWVVDRHTMQEVGSLTLAHEVGPTMPNHVLVDGDRAFVVASGTHEIVAVDLADRAKPQVLYSVSTGEGSNPMAAALDDDGVLWVSLWLSHSVLPIRVDGTQGEALDPIATASEELEGTPYPAGVATAAGRVFVSLNNLDDSFAPAGNGRLWALDPEEQQVDLIDLGADCTNPGMLATHGEAVFVACAGSFGADDGAVAVYEPSKALDTRTWVTGGSPGRIAIDPSTPSILYLADNASTDILRLDTATGETDPIRACSAQEWEFVSDVLAVP